MCLRVDRQTRERKQSKCRGGENIWDFFYFQVRFCFESLFGSLCLGMVANLPSDR